MLTFETYDDENAVRLPSTLLEDIAALMNQHGYTVCDLDEDTITFIAE